MTPLPKIYCFVGARYRPIERDGPTDVVSYAIAEDGTVLASHYSTEGYHVHDMGCDGPGGDKWKHDQYAAHYPDGFNVEWVNDPEAHPALIAALEKNKAMTPKEKVEAS